MPLSNAHLKKRFAALLSSACDMEPHMVLEFVEDCRERLDAIEFRAVQDLAEMEVPDAQE